MKRGVRLKRILIIPLLALLIVSLGSLSFFVFTGNVVGNVGLSPNDNLTTLSNYNQYQIQNTRDVNGNIYPSVSMNGSQLPKYSGYIIEFIDDPLIKKKVELDKQKGLSLASADSQLNDYKNQLNKDHDTTKNAILSTLNKGGIGLASVDNKIQGEYKNVFNGIALNVSDSEAQEIKKIQGVKEVYRNYGVHTTLMDSVPLIGADKVWQLDKNGNNCVTSGQECLTGKGIKIAIIDTGVDYTHPDLGGCTREQFLGKQCSKVIDGWDFSDKDNDPMDDQGHGTHVAATAAGNGILKGVAPDSKIFAYKVFPRAGYDSGVIISAIERAVDPNQDGNFNDHVDVISMSLGGPGNPDDPMSQAVDNAVDVGVVAVIAAGNSGPGEQTIGSPGTARKVITIGASDKQDKIADFSSRGSVVWQDSQGVTQYLIKPDITSPGVNICAAQSSQDTIWQGIMTKTGRDSHCLDNKHISISGTSMATPHVAGTVALIKQAHPDWTPEDIKNSLKNTAKDLGQTLNAQGYGRIDVEKAVKSKKFLISFISTNGRISGSYADILGTVSGGRLMKYTLYYSSKGSSNWISICSGNSQIINSVLCKLSIGNLKDGDYLLKLIGEDGSQQSRSYSLISIGNTEINFPNDLSKYDFFSDLSSMNQKVIFKSGESIDIKGTATGSNFASYSLKWCDSTGVCNLDGISLVNGGTLPVDKNILGHWIIPTNIKPGFYDLFLLNKNKSNSISSVSVKIYIETGLHKGNWPNNNISLSAYTMRVGSYQPTIVDMNKDHKNELIFYTGEKTIHIIDSNGNELSGWPKDIESGYGLTRSIAVGDINNDRANEIVASDSGGFVHILNSRGQYLVAPIYIYNFGGNPQQDWQKVLSDPVLADIDNNGYKNIVVGGFGYLYVLNYRGEILKGWPQNLYPSPNYPKPDNEVSYAVGDINNDGYKEIVALSQSRLMDSNTIGEENLRAWVFNRDGSVMIGWPKDFKEGMSKGVVLADLNLDNNREIIFSSYNGIIHVLKADGSNFPGWPVKIGNFRYSDLSVGDVNSDGKPEIFLIGENTDNNLQGCLFGYNSQGISLGKFPICNTGDLFSQDKFGCSFAGTPILANLDSDSELEITSACKGMQGMNGLYPIYAFNLDGSIVTAFPKYVDSLTFGTLVLPVGDSDSDGKNELIVPTLKQTFVYDSLGGSDDSSRNWPQFQHDAQHTGCYDCDKTLIPSTNLISNGDFSSGLTSWKSSNGNSNPSIQGPSVDNGILVLQGYGFAYQTFNYKAGKTYNLSFLGYATGSEIVGSGGLQNENTWQSLGSVNVAPFVWKNYSLLVPIPQSETAPIHVVLATRPTDKDKFAYAFFDNVRIEEVAASASNNGLIANYKFDGNYQDSSGNNNNGVASGGVTLVSDSYNGKSQTVANFDGTGYVNTPLKTLPRTNFTLSFWQKPTALGSAFQYRPFGAADSARGYYGLDYAIYDGAGHSFVVMRSGTNMGTMDFVCGASPTPGTWEFVTITVDSSKGATCYRNGVNTASNLNSKSISTGTLTVHVGSSGDGGAKYYGRIDDVRIYNRVLSASEIKDIYNVG